VCAPGHSQDDQDLVAAARVLEAYFDERRLLPCEPAPETPEEITGYRRYLTALCGLAGSTITDHLATASEFLRFVADHNPTVSLEQLTPTALEGFVQQLAARVSQATFQHIVAHLRSFLRWLAAQGHAPKGLDSQIDTPRVYRQEQLPRALPWATVRALLQSIDRTSLGRRDYPMLLLIATYGLCSSEIVALTLDDVAWRRGQLRVPRREVDDPFILPLTDAAGAALLDYLQHGRPPLPTRVLSSEHVSQPACRNRRR
jgi:integrase/recombinase XerD